MKLRRLFAGALALALGLVLARDSGPVLAQETGGTSPQSVAKGGTGASTAAAARTNLGLGIGTNVEAWDADLDCLAALATTGVLHRSGAGTCNTNQVANSEIAPGAANTVKGSLNGTTTSDLAIASCSAIYQFTQWVTGSGWQCGIVPVLPSRAVAATLNLSAFTSVVTLGYATPADGGGAHFKDNGSAGFVDSFISTGSSGCPISAAGSGYVNGSYLGVPLSGGSGTNAIANITVAGTAVTVVNVVGTGGNSYKASDVLSANNVFLGGSGSGFTCTLSSVSTPLGSFTDTGSKKWQVIADSGNYLNLYQFGGKGDWAGSDGGATNNFSSIQACMAWAAQIRSPTIDAGGTAGTKCILPPGNFMACTAGSSPLQLPGGVTLEGANAWSSEVRMCTAWPVGVHFFTICDPSTHTACFASQMRGLTLSAANNQASSANVAMIFSNNIQQIDFLDRVALYVGQRAGIWLEVGYGGAALLGMQNVECTPSNAVTALNPCIHINFGTTEVTMRNVHAEGSATITNSGIRIVGGFLSLIGFHTEGMTTGIEVNIPTSLANGMVTLQNLSGGTACTGLVLLQSTNKAGNMNVSNAVPNGCTNVVLDGQAGGVSVTTPILNWTIFNP